MNCGRLRSRWERQAAQNAKKEGDKGLELVGHGGITAVPEAFDMVEGVLLLTEDEENNITGHFCFDSSDMSLIQAQLGDPREGFISWFDVRSMELS